MLQSTIVKCEHGFFSPLYMTSFNLQRKLFYIFATIVLFNNDIRYFLLKKIYFLAQIFLQLALLPSLGHEKAIGTLGYPIASKLED